MLGGAARRRSRRTWRPPRGRRREIARASSRPCTTWCRAERGSARPSGLGGVGVPPRREMDPGLARSVARRSRRSDATSCSAAARSSWPGRPGPLPWPASPGRRGRRARARPAPRARRNQRAAAARSPAHSRSSTSSRQSERRDVGAGVRRRGGQRPRGRARLGRGHRARGRRPPRRRWSSVRSVAHLRRARRGAGHRRRPAASRAGARRGRGPPRVPPSWASPRRRPAATPRVLPDASLPPQRSSSADPVADQAPAEAPERRRPAPRRRAARGRPGRGRCRPASPRRARRTSSAGCPGRRPVPDGSRFGDRGLRRRQGVEEAGPVDEQAAPGELHQRGWRPRPRPRAGSRARIRSIVVGAGDVEAAHRDPRQQAERLGRLAGVQPVLDRRHAVAHALQPPGRAGVLLAQPLGRAPLELGEQHLAHQAVHLEPPTGVEAGDEQAPLLGLQQQVAGVASPGERLGQPVVHPVDDGGRQRAAPRARRARPAAPRATGSCRRAGPSRPGWRGASSPTRGGGRSLRAHGEGRELEGGGPPPDHAATAASSCSAVSGHSPASSSRSSGSENRRASKPTSASSPAARSRSIGEGRAAPAQQQQVQPVGLVLDERGERGPGRPRCRRGGGGRRPRAPRRRPRVSSRSSVRARRRPSVRPDRARRPRPVRRRPGRATRPPRSARRRTAAGSRSDSSRASQAEGLPQWRSQSAARAVLPAPAGATTAVTGYAARSSSSSISRVRRTRWRGAVGTRNLDRKKGESNRPRWRAPAGASASCGHRRAHVGRRRAFGWSSAPPVCGPAPSRRDVGSS